MTDWLVRFDAGLRQLREREVDLGALDDAAGWRLLRPASQQNVESGSWATCQATAADSPGASCSCACSRTSAGRRTCARRLRVLGIAGRDRRRAGVRSPPLGRRSSNVAGEPEGDDGNLGEGEGDDAAEGDAQGTVRHELEAAIAELEAAGVGVSEAFNTRDAALVEAAAAALAAIPEAMAAIRSARDAFEGRGKAGAPKKRAAAKSAIASRADQLKKITVC